MQKKQNDLIRQDYKGSNVVSFSAYRLRKLRQQTKWDVKCPQFVFE